MTTTPPNKTPISSQQQSLGDVQVQGDDNIFNVVQGKVVTLNQNKIIQISVDEIKTREFISTSPYKGLRRFESEDKDRFFGRDQFITGLVNELEHTNFVLLLGASGSGKSSVVRAGLIPWLAEKWGSDWVNLSFTPDCDPFDSLYGSLLSCFKQSEAQVARKGTEETLNQLVKTLKQPESFWFVFIDQFEELFTTTEAEKRDRFIKSLAKLCQTHAKDRTLKIVATMRADFLDRLDVAPANRLARLTEGHRPLITQMQPDELRLAIEQPAAHHGVVFEEGLVEEIIKDVQGQAGYLPLMQYTLNMLWETEVRDGGINDRTLNIQSYRRIGGVRGALQQRVEEIYTALSKEEKLAAQRIFLKLVGIGGEAATDWRPVRKREARSRFSDAVEQTVLTQLIDANLLVSDAPVEGSESESMVEIAHEILLTSWNQLKVWIGENREAIALRNRLNSDVEQWKTTKPDDELWGGIKLAKVAELQNSATFKQVLGGFEPDATAFIEASLGQRDRQLKKKETQRRRFVVGLSGFSIVALALSGAALYQLQQVERQRVNLLATTATSQLATKPVEGAINALAAIGLSRSTFVQFPNRPRFALAERVLLETLQSNSERNRLLLHDNDVVSVVFSPDGKKLVSGSYDKSVRLWDAETGRPIGEPLMGHDGAVYSVAFSPDGKKLVSGSHDKSMRLWDAETGEPIGEPLTGHGRSVSSVAFSPDGKRLVSGSSDKSVRLWDAETGKPIGKPLTDHGSSVSSVAFSPNGKKLVSGSDHNVRLWDAETGKPIGKPFTGHNGWVSSVAFSPDGKKLVSGGSDHNVRLWDAETGKPIGKPFTGHNGWVSSVAFSPDGKKLVSGSWDNSLRLWDVETGNPMGEPLMGHDGDVSSVAFSPDGKQLVSGSDDNSVRLWDIERSNPTGGRLIEGDGGISSVAFSPNGKKLVSGSGNSMRLWDAETGEPMGEPLMGHDRTVSSVTFSSDGKKLVSSSEDNSVRLWDAETGEPIGAPLTGHDDGVLSAAFSPNGKKLVSGSRDNSVRLWDAETGEPIGKPLMGHEGWVSSVAFSPNGKKLVSSGWDNSVRLWDAETGEPIGEPLMGHDDGVSSVAFSPNGKKLVSGSRDKSVRLWDTETGEPIGEPLMGHDDLVLSVAFSPDGKKLVSSGWDNSVRLWDAETGNPIGEPLTGHDEEIYSVAFSPDGKKLVSGSHDKSIRLWDVSPNGWLHKVCLQLQDHPVLNDANNNISKKAKQTCEKYVYRLTRQGQPSQPYSRPPHAAPPFDDAIKQATAADALAQIAKNTEQWNDVAYHWQQAINLMKAVPTSAPNYTTAQQKIEDYQENLAYAQAQAKANQ